MPDVYVPISTDAVERYQDTGTTTADGRVIVAQVVASEGGGGGSLPPDAATATNQDTEISYLVNVDGNVTNIKDNVAAILPFVGIDTTAIKDRIGEVGANPTANTMLARLKTIADNTVRANLVFTAQTIGTANAGVAKAAPGQVFSLYCENENAAKRYLLLLNQTSTPTNGQTPVRAYGVLPNGGIVLDVVYFGANGLSFGNGIAWAFSSTKNTVTLATASDCTFEVAYV